METSTLPLFAYGLSFLIGLGVALRPFALVLALLLRPALFAKLALVLAAGGLVLARAVPAEAGAELIGGAVAAGAGGLTGLKLRRLTRGGL